MEYDVIVVGAGPAGSTAARECASRGLSSLLLEKATFPRDKPCGGGVNVRAARLLPFDLEEVTERTIRGMFVSVCREGGFLRRSGEPLSYLTQRRRLDAFLAERAQRAGAILREGHAVRSVERGAGHVTVRASGEVFRGRSLIAADGANGPTARLVGMPLLRRTAIALEGNVVPSGSYPARWEDVFAVNVGDAPGGYGWLFPKGDHLNVGVGGWQSIGPTLRRRLDDLTRFYALDPSALFGVRGHPLPVALGGAILAQGNVALVGDAAGLLDPLTGEGIYAAIRSGTTAARHVAAYVDGAAPDLRGYAREMRDGMLEELQVSVQLCDIFHMAPSAWAGVLRRSPRVWRAVCRLLTGELDYPGIKHRMPGLSHTVDVTSDLVRLVRHSLDRVGTEGTPPPQGPLRWWLSRAHAPLN